MVVKLGAADSFNSSGATIVPDPRHDDNTSPPNNVSNLSYARVLMPQDTLGRELESALGGGDLQNSQAAWELFQQIQNQADDTVPLSLTQSQSETLDFSSFLASQPSDNETTTDIFSNLQLDNPVQTPFRPLSSHSHRGSVSGSDYSYTTTEMSSTDTDGDGDSHMEFKVEWAETTSISPQSAISPHEAQGVSPSLLGGGGPAGEPLREDDKKRKEKLEHRRSINRRSAQKHRLRRKEELESISHTLALREARIAQLERDLAVAHAQSAQLLDLLKSQGIDLGSKMQTRGRGAPW
ncbi:hypothetical protein BCR39DRAFT_532211 [Naematelia encephala]|uniref:BZIP domain-containing protein n=1 Tax=Naematelia encephala TaxID=71784 RepID=A0A1Y2B5C9_9TREE|nr:hypothetical protein BCR39DRAFT_532211 [Naematelia encephala]